MYFTVDDVIKLKDKEYLVKRVALINIDAYYEVFKLEDGKPTKEKLIIEAIKEEDKLFIEEIKEPDLLVKIENNLKS